MTKKERRIFFYAVALLFLILAPLLTFYTSGYTYLVGTGIVQLGSMIIETEPIGARIFLNEKDTLLSTPTRIKNLRPDQYLITIKKDGWYPWKKIVEVRPGQTNLMINIPLFKRSLPTTLTLQVPLTQAISSSTLFDQKFAYSTRDQSFATVQELSIKNRMKASTLFRTSAKESQRLDVLGYSKNQRFLLVQSNNDFLVIDTQLENTQMFSKNEFESLEWARWDESSRWILTKTATEISFVQPSDMGRIMTLPDSSIIDALYQDEYIYTLSSENNTSTTVDRFAKENTLFKKEQTLTHISVSPTWRFISSPQGLLTLLDNTRQELLVFNISTQKKILETRASSAVWRADTLYYFTQNEISIFHANKKTPQLIVRYGNPITNIVPMWRHNFILYLLENTIMLHELDFENTPNVISLTLPKEMQIQNFFLDEKDEKLILIDQEGISAMTLQ